MAIPLDKVPGIGPKSAEHLRGLGIDSAEALLKAGSAALLGTPGFHEGRANAVLEAAAGLVIASEESVMASPETGEEKQGKKGKKKKEKKEQKGKGKEDKKKKDKKEKKKKDVKKALKKKDKKKGKKKRKKNKKG